MFSDTARPWDPFGVPEEALVRKDIGPLTLWFRRESGELHVASTHNAGPDTHPASWSRYVLRESDTRVRLVPLMPDKPAVVRSEFPFHLLRGTRAKIYTRIPCWVGVEVVGSGLPVRLHEVPSQNLSNTWFGDFVGGELCYWVATSARREMPLELIQDHHIVCILDIRNESERNLQIEKLSLRTERLSIFRHNGRLWADDTQVVFDDDAESAEIRNDGLAPAELPGAEKLSDARLPHKKGLAERAMYLFKEATE